MVVTLAVPARAFFGLKSLITMRHLDNMNRMILGTSLLVGYAYAAEVFMAWYGGNSYEQSKGAACQSAVAEIVAHASPRAVCLAVAIVVSLVTECNRRARCSGDPVGSTDRIWYE